MNMNYCDETGVSVLDCFDQYFPLRPFLIELLDFLEKNP